MRKRLQRWLGRRVAEQEMREEMEFHLEARVGTLMGRGMSRQEAARTARIEFGGAEAHREECRAALGYRPWDELRSDIRFAGRTLRNQPGYAAAATAILALAIGANSAFFTLFSRYVLEPLPIRGAERHFDLSGLDREGRSTGGWTATEIEALREATQGRVEGFYTNRTISVLALEPTQRPGIASFVSGNYFRLLGMNAAVGRTFSEGEEREALAVLSRAGQRRHFPGDPAPLGKKLRVRATVLTVIGVMPPELTGTEFAAPDFWVGSEMTGALLGEGSEDREPRYKVAGLLAPGASPAQAEGALTMAAARFARSADEAVTRVELTPRSGYFSTDAGSMTAAGLVFAMFLVVLMIACANLANLCLSRAASRTHEIGMRVSLGASRGRIIRQLLTESTCIALLGAAGGVAVGALGIQEAQGYLASFAGRMGVMLPPVHTDWRVIVFCAGLGVLAGLAFGLLPAIEVTSPNLTLSTKREHSSFAGRVRPRRMRDILIAGQAASSLVLLILGGILIRHIQSLNAASPGYDLDRVFDLRLDRLQPALLAVIEQQPEIASVSAVERVPLYGQLPLYSANVDGRAVRLSYNHVDQRFFETLELQVHGRGFTAQEAAANAKVVIVSGATARALWPDALPLGRTITMEGPQAGVYEVIGVAPDVMLSWVFGKDATAVYFPSATGQPEVLSAVVRIHGEAGPTVAKLRELCATVGDGSGCEPTSLRELWALQQFPFQAAAGVAGALGALALALTAVGLYSVTSYSVLQRRREIGVHLALGGTPAQVMSRIVRQACRSVAIGLVAGLPVCVLLSRLLDSSVFGIKGYDLSAYTAIPTLLAAITALACALPAHKAARMDPVACLREE